MNSCILMAQIIQAPELRYTQDNQTPLAQMMVEFDGLRDMDPPNKLKVVGWGNMAAEIEQNYKVGDRVILQGRLQMNTIDRPEGFKEKRAEFNVSHIYKYGDDIALPNSSSSSGVPSAARNDSNRNDNVVPFKDYNKQGANPGESVPASSSFSSDSNLEENNSEEDSNYDDIPF